MKLEDNHFKQGADLRAFYGLGFVRYQAQHIIALRAYLYEKVQMGLFYRVELYEEKHLVPRPNDTVTPLRLWLGGVRQKIWEDILVPGIQEYVLLQDHAKMNSLVYGCNDITIWVRKKPCL